MLALVIEVYLVGQVRSIDLLACLVSHIVHTVELLQSVVGYLDVEGLLDN